MFDAYSRKFLNLKSAPDFQLANMWALEFADFPHRDFLIYETSMPLPNLNYSKTSWDLVTPESHENLGEFTFTFYETLKFEGSRFFQTWMNEIYDFEKRVWRKGYVNKKKNAKLKYLQIKSTDKGYFGSAGNIYRLITRKEKFEIYETASLEVFGLLPSGIGDISADSETGEPLTFTATMNVQHIKANLNYIKLS